MKYKIYNSEFVAWANSYEGKKFHAVLCDPPYGLEFMGKEWDSFRTRRKDKRSWKSDAEKRSSIMGENLPHLYHAGIGYEKAVKSWGKALRKLLYPGALVFMFGGCYDRKTEVLTRAGWKYFVNVTTSDEIATLNPDTNQLEYQRPIEIVRQPYHGKMYRLLNKCVDLFVTADHKMYVSSICKPKKFRLRPALETAGKHLFLKKSALWNGRKVKNFVLPGVKNRCGSPSRWIEQLPDITIPMDSWLKFFGLYIAEGSATRSKARKGSSYTVKLTHFNMDNLNEIERELKSYFSVCRYKGALVIHGRQLWSYMRQFGQAPEKHVPDWLKLLSSRQIRIFLKWYLRGDGDAYYRAYTSSTKLRDDLQELALKAGWSADYYKGKEKTKPSYIRGREIHQRHDQWRVAIHRNRTEVYKNPYCVDEEYWADFDGEVYCVEVPNHVIYVRRGGKAVWCGNTRTWHRLAVGMEDAGFELWDTIMWLHGQGFPKAQAIDKLIDKMNGDERKVVGQRTVGIGTGKGSTPIMGDGNRDLTISASKQSAPWSGHKTSALKPAWEPILCFRAPDNNKTYAELALKYGSGCLNVDKGRIAGVMGPDRAFGKPRINTDKYGTANSHINPQSPFGRYPANLCLDKKSARMLNEFDGASRFFYTAKAPKYERNEGLKNIPRPKQNKSKPSGNLPDDHISLRLTGQTYSQNYHPTVKPVSLNKWLAAMLLPAESVKRRRLLVPFSGSGSEMIGALRAGWDKVIGVEMNKDYCRIAKSRLKYWKKYKPVWKNLI